MIICLAININYLEMSLYFDFFFSINMNKEHIQPSSRERDSKTPTLRGTKFCDLNNSPNINSSEKQIHSEEFRN